MNRRLVVSLLGLFSLAVTATASPLTDLNARLGRSHAGWKAGESWVTRLSKEERKKLLGAPLQSEDYFVARGTERAAGADKLDWRDRDGVNFVSPMLNQGRCGSCVAFAAISTLETQTNITRQTPSSPWAYSSQHLFACGGGSCNMGWTPGSAASFLKSKGVPDEACFPYQSGALGEDLACSKTCASATERTEKIAGSSMPTFFMADVEAVKAALQKGPLMTVMTVYDDFFYYKSGVYKHVSGDVAGGHALSIVGYDETQRAWIVKNSWGDDWGDKGYFLIDWDDASGLGRQTWLLNVASPNGFVTIGSLRDHDVLKGTVDISAQSTFPDTKGIEIKLAQSGRAAFRAAGSRATLDTTTFADGVYTATAVAQHAAGTSTSQPRTIYVLNGALTGNLAFTNVTAGQTFSGSFVFEMTTQASPVPFATVTFRAKNVATGEEIKRATPNVATKMAINWRMKDAPSGEYDLTLEGASGDQLVKSAPVRVTVKN